MSYQYDGIGQLTNAIGVEQDLSTRRLQEQFGYAYDNAWNLSSRNRNGFTETFSANSVNELTTISRSGALTVAGTTTSPASGVNVSGTGISGSQPAAVYADSTWALGGVTPANGQNTWNASATDSTYGRTSQASVTVNLPTTASFSYDANGNLLGDGTRSFAYDDENELTSVWVTNAWRSDFLYDGMLRRRIRREYTWSSGTWLQTNEVHYVYDGMVVIQERYFEPQISSSIPQNAVTYTRGSDLGGDLKTAGGIGGVLARSDSGLLIGGSPSGHDYYHFDGNGNVTCLISMSNSIVALYQYDPFGNTISELGSLASANLYRFACKEYHANSALIYYGYRFYDAGIQRWITRDPIESLGGLNGFWFVRNSPFQMFDRFGLQCEGAEDDLDWELNEPIFGADLWETPEQRAREEEDARAERIFERALQAAEAARAAARAQAAAAEAASRAAAAVRVPDSVGSNINAPASRLTGYPVRPQYPPGTPPGGNFQFNFDTSENFRNSRSAGVARARAEGLVKPGEEAHHINSVQTHPHLAAEPSNIEGMDSRQEHLDTHGGNWQNPTTGPLCNGR